MSPQPIATATPFPPPPSQDPLLPSPDDALPSPILTLAKRQSVVTLSVTASPTAAPTGPAQKSFPIAVAIPALVGGMALAIFGFGLWWWMSKRKRKQRQADWERVQRRKKRQHDEANASRPSLSSSRKASSSKSPTSEKHYIPPLPILPKIAVAPQNEKYSYSPNEYQYQPQQLPPHEQQQQYGYQQYAGEHDNTSVHPSDSQSSTTPLNEEHRAESPAPTGESTKPARPSRSTARVAVAENAAATAFGDPNTRYQPKKPSPLALKAAEEKRAAELRDQKWGDGPFRQPPTSPYDSSAQETLDRAPVPADQAYLAPPSEGEGQGPDRQVSGEWGVALGSPNHDGSFEQQMTGDRSRYSDDPYLNGNGGGGDGKLIRGKSGMYTTDPYEAYHDQLKEAQRNWV